MDTAGTEHDLLLKSQSATAWSNGVIEVLYDHAGHRAQVWTFTSAQNWVQRGADIPVTLANGDQFGARAKADGTVGVYRNGTLLATRDVSGWPYYAGGGYVGLWFLGANTALLDDFGGGTVVAGSGVGGGILAASAPNVFEGSEPPITLARFVQSKGSRIVADSALPQAPVAGGAAKGFASPLMLAQSGELTTTTITYAYDGLYRVKDAVYSTGEEFHYEYDAVGNVLTYTHLVGQLTVVTTYTYNSANQLLTAHASNESTTWHYLYDNNGSLTDVIPNGTTPESGARRYVYNAAGFLTRAETHDGTTYQPQAEMQYNGLGERVSMTGWQGEISLTTS